ncbi:MAG: S9 family peptidase [Actinomycetales bacterium]|nr:S9 family peptidase [Actinomycetales bacterium]
MPAWERRFRAPRVGLPRWADDAPSRCAVLATADGVLEGHSWDAATGRLVRATRRREGTSIVTIDPSGEWVWWFDDANGDEYGVWRRQPFGAEPGEGVEDAAGLPAAYPAGLALGRGGLAVVGSTDDGYGSRIHVITRDGAAPASRLLYAHPEDAGVSGLSEDGTLVAVAHSEHGDSRHPALRVLRVRDGGVVGDLWDGPAKGVEAADFAPTAGDCRLLVHHERRGHGELLIWDVARDEQAELVLDLPGEVSDADWYTDGRAVLVALDHEARTRLVRIDLDETGMRVAAVTPVGPAEGTVLGATPRPDGGVWLSWSSSAQPAAVRDLDGRLVLAAPGEPAPPSVRIEDVWVDGPGGRVHALLRRPVGPDGTPLAGPLPLLVDVHGGPAAHDVDSFRAYPAAWVDHGFAAVQVNYRGSTGYGSAWRDALERRIGHTELEDVVAVRDHLVAEGIADASRVVLAGASWGGFLTLLGLGVYPDRWALGLAGVPVADYLTAYEDEMEGLKAFDRSLFGGSPEEVPDRYRDSSPLTYVDTVRAPVLVLAGENDPRCPIRQIENYLAALTERGVPHEVYRFDAGHGSLVDDERVRQTRAEIDFALRHLAR